MTVKADAVRLVKPGILEEWMAVLPAPATPLSTAFWSASGNVRSSFAEAFHRAGEALESCRAIAAWTAWGPWVSRQSARVDHGLAR